MYRVLVVLASLFLVAAVAPVAAEDRLAVLQTPSGDIVIEFFADDAPIHVENFVNLVETGAYEQTVFHRVIPGFMIQGGDPSTKPGAYNSTSEWGTGSPGYTIDAEFNTIKHNRGIVSMARSAHPDSAGSQFFIVHADSNFLDGQYTVFGRIVTQESFDTLDTIASMETAPPGNIPVAWEDTEITEAFMVPRSEVSDILSLDPPERTHQIISSGDPYVNDNLGVSAIFPPGWLVQEPPKIQPGVPDIVAVSPVEEGFPPSFSISIEFTGDRSLDEFVDTVKQQIQPFLDSGEVTITEEGEQKYNDRDSYMLSLDGMLSVPDGDPIAVNFKQIILETPEKFYTFTYTSTAEEFDDHLEMFDETINSFKILSEQSGDQTETMMSDDNQDDQSMAEPDDADGGCLIATAAYGSELAEPVQRLRELRDNTLLKSPSGAAFMTGFNQIYYSFSPTIADWQRESPVFKEAVRISITPMISVLSVLNHVEIESESELLAYGVAAIMAVIGLYAAVPVAALYVLRR